MLDKIRLQASGALPERYLASLGDSDPRSCDARCCAFLGVTHAQVVARVREGLEDLWILEWCLEHGTRRDLAEINAWNQSMETLGFEDGVESVLDLSHLAEEAREAIKHLFDLIEADESRILVTV